MKCRELSSAVEEEEEIDGAVHELARRCPSTRQAAWLAGSDAWKGVSDHPPSTPSDGQYANHLTRKKQKKADRREQQSVVTAGIKAERAVQGGCLRDTRSAAPARQLGEGRW